MLIAEDDGGEEKDKKTEHSPLRSFERITKSAASFRGRKLQLSSPRTSSNLLARYLSFLLPLTQHDRAAQAQIARD